MAIAPPVIITPTTSVQKAIKTRTPFIAIANPDPGDVIISMSVEQKLVLDGRPVAPLATDDPDNPGINTVRRNFNDLAVVAKVVTVTDPVTKQDVTISVAGIAAAIQQNFCDWYAQDLEAKLAAPAPSAPAEQPAATELAQPTPVQPPAP